MEGLSLPAPVLRTAHQGDAEAPQGTTAVEQSAREAGWIQDHLLLDPGFIAGEDAPSARAISLRNAAGRTFARALVTPAEESVLLGRARLPKAALGRSLFVSDVAVDPEAPPDALAALLYFCGRRGRIQDRKVLATALAGGPTSGRATPVAPRSRRETPRNTAPVSFGRLANVRPVESLGRPFVVSAQRLDLAIHQANRALSPASLSLVREHLVPEAVETLERWLAGFLDNAWFRAVREGTMTREQYVATLSNLHQFVRWTTRLIGRAIGVSKDRAVRTKWLHHLQGEVDHEVILERDLAALGADVDYVVTAMVPSVDTQMFMVTQESLVAFHEDPVLFMAAPFVAEGFAANLDGRFIRDLRAAAERWGIDNPRQVTAFFASHIEFDGGADGHWEMGRALLRDHLTTDGDLCRFMNAARLCMRAFDGAYAGYVEDLSLFGASSMDD